MINEQLKDSILNHYGIGQTAFLGGGMEALVYKLDEQRVLKIYNEMTTISKQTRLKDFYRNLGTEHVAFQLPRIEQILEYNGTIVTIESLIEGKSMRYAIEHSSGEKLEKLMENHLNTLLEMRKVNSEDAIQGIKLFNENNESKTVWQDWYGYLKHLLIRKLKIVEDYLSQNVTNFNWKVSTLMHTLENDYTGEYNLIHGDFCPENIQVNSKGEVTGIIDFGLMTMRGDFLFDVATGWLFIDMYNQYPYDFREKYLELIIQKLGEPVKYNLALYILLYSIYSVNFYSNDYNDGHAEWCVKNLNDKGLWMNLGL